MTRSPAGRASLARRLGAGIGWALVIGLLVLVWPSSLGGCTTLTVVTGQSMQPTLQPGDFALLRCGEPRVGDVIAYRPFDDQRSLVIHRIIGGDGASGWVLQGDNNDFIDPFYPRQHQVQGSLVVSVPKVGLVVSFIGLPVVWGSAFLLAAGLLWYQSLRKREDAAGIGEAAEVEAEPAPDTVGPGGQAREEEPAPAQLEEFFKQAVEV